MKKLEEQSPIQSQSTDRIKKVSEKANSFISGTKQYANYIAIGGLIIVSLVISMVTVQDGNIGIVSFEGFTVLRYILFVVQIIIPPVLALIIMETFRKQGIVYGKDSIRDVILKYIELESRHKTQPRPRSEKQYNREQLLKNSMTKFIFIMLFTFLTASIILSGSINSLVSVLVNIFMAVMFGFKQMIDAMQYTENELILWYKERIIEMEAREAEGEEKNGLEG